MNRGTRTNIPISTIASFKMKRFNDSISKHDGQKLLIVDEAHRFTVRPETFD